jgi:hypothetical protein
MHDEFYDSSLVELRPGWVVRRPWGVSDFEFAKYRFEPVTIALLIGGALSTAGSISQAQAAKAEGKAQNQIAEFNARQLEAQSQSRMEAARMDEGMAARKARILQGRMIAKQGASGSLEGSPLEILSDLVYETQTERALTLRAGVMDATTMRNQATIQRWQGRWAKAYGGAQAKAGYMKAAGTALGAGADIYKYTEDQK